MNWLRFRMRPSSLLSMRVPYTYQSALSYPLPPPSTLKGLAASALYHYRGGSPDKWVSWIEEKVQLAVATPSDLDSRSSIGHSKAFATSRSLMVKVLKFDGAKDPAQDALPRAFIWSEPINAYFFSPDGSSLGQVSEALQFAPLFLGDGESLVSPEGLAQGEAQVGRSEAGEPFDTPGYIAQELCRDVQGSTTLYWVHEQVEDATQLYPYFFPIVEGQYLEMCWIRGTLVQDVQWVQLDDRRFYLPPDRKPVSMGKRRRPSRV